MWVLNSIQYSFLAFLLGRPFPKKHTHILIKTLMSQQEIIPTFGMRKPRINIRTSILTWIGTVFLQTLMIGTTIYA